jgi:hypothetical protein
MNTEEQNERQLSILTKREEEKREESIERWKEPLALSVLLFFSDPPLTFPPPPSSLTHSQSCVLCIPYILVA